MKLRQANKIMKVAITNNRPKRKAYRWSTYDKALLKANRGAMLRIMNRCWGSTLTAEMMHTDRRLK